MLCVSSDGKQCHYYQQKSICGCAKPVPKCPTLYVLVFIVVSDVEVRGDCLFCWYWWNCWPSWLKPSFHNNMSHRIVEYEKDYWISIFMFCKSQHGKIEGIWYLQISKAWQVVECVWLDWCNLIIIQNPTKYKIRTKYNDNLKPNEYNESRKTTLVLPEPTYRRTKIKEQERTKGIKLSSLKK
jgi:hypothetical protein